MVALALTGNVSLKPVRMLKKAGTSFDELNMNGFLSTISRSDPFVLSV